ncbi:MAG: hypothetical protein ACREIT_07815, partial [Tepidisphaeraceae bacterium]
FEARTGGFNTVGFPSFLKAYRPLMSVRNVRLFVSQARAFRLFLNAGRLNRAATDDTQLALALGHCLATIAYGQLIAENAALLGVPAPMVSAMFHTLVADLSASALALASFPRLSALRRVLIGRLIAIPRSSSADWDFVSAKLRADVWIA